MRYSCKSFLIALVLVVSFTKLSAQTLFDVPAKCAVALKLDVVKYASSSSQQLAFLRTIDDQTYEQLKSSSGGSGGVSFAGFNIGGTANYEDFKEKRSSLFDQIGYSLNESDAENLLTQTTSARAFQSFDTCMVVFSRSQAGFQAWRSSEDLNDLVLNCHYTSPPASTFPDGIPRPITVTVSLMGHPDTELTVGAGDDCKPIVVPRSQTGGLVITISGGGSSFVFKSEVSPPAENVVSVSYFPLHKVDDVQVFDQTSMPAPFGQGTTNMNGAGGCPSAAPPIACDGTRKHFATSIALAVFPPADGDLYDPAQAKITSSRDVGGDQGGAYCDQFSTMYFVITPPQPPPPGVNLPPETAAWLANMQRSAGKHMVTVIERCWGYPALVNVRAPSYHIVPAANAVDGGTFRFGPNDSIIFGVDDGAISKVQFTYKGGMIDVVKAGQPTSDGKMICTKTFPFNGKTFYVYREK